MTEERSLKLQELRRAFISLYQKDESEIRSLAKKRDFKSEDIDEVLKSLAESLRCEVYHSSVAIAILLSMGWTGSTFPVPYRLSIHGKTKRYSRKQTHLIDAMLRNRGVSSIQGYMHEYRSYIDYEKYERKVSRGLRAHIEKVQHILDDKFQIESISNVVGYMLWPVDYPRRNRKRAREEWATVMKRRLLEMERVVEFLHAYKPV